jgi:hypothetical protein
VGLATYLSEEVLWTYPRTGNSPKNLCQGWIADYQRAGLVPGSFVQLGPGKLNGRVSYFAHERRIERVTTVISVYGMR